MKEKENQKWLITVIIINFFIFALANILFTIKYEQVDDFIIYNLYSGLDGTYNIHGVYIHPLICFIISIFFKIIPIINWHSIFLLSMQFLCFTIIGYTILKKQKSGIAILLYTIFATVFYTSLLLLIQYTSVAALLILTSFIVFIDLIEKEEKTKISTLILMFILFALGIMIRMQSLLIIIPFFTIYFIFSIIKFKFYKTIQKDKVIKVVKYYLIYALITLIIYVSNLIIYNSNEVYKEYMEYNDIRATLHDIIYVDYEQNKEIFDEIGWTENDHYLFYTFNFGDENKYSKENLQKILDYKIQKDGRFDFNTNLSEIKDSFVSELVETNTFIAIVFITVFVVCLFNKNKTKENIIIFLTTIGVHLLFIIIGRSMLRVVIPEYIIGTAWMLYNLNLQNKNKVNDSVKNCIIVAFIIICTCTFAGNKYEFGYDLDNYKSYRKLIEYTNNHKENVYLYTVPSLQDRYLTYPVYLMPPKGAFSNLRVLGGWDMFTQNYYDFKERYNLDGNFLDLLKENVYLVDGDVYWSGRVYEDYKQSIIQAIKENYNIDVKCEEIESFKNLKIYKLTQKD